MQGGLAADPDGHRAVRPQGAADQRGRPGRAVRSAPETSRTAEEANSSRVRARSAAVGADGRRAGRCSTGSLLDLAQVRLT
ncbi:hypothetical protein KCH_18670 [Kitasatospora cheerisanensis KCTC 2395]|uniref:Uncharacterized protein n=1 Tax=Kitasatospora cheerisanensis KCTC 2395 TaxID=1348663 RepID=A0A066Z789_9ACTN|nr:hypothetical protein KCH_18670 [Kitasatospora cheerisanensis KCTC 2395]